MKWKSIESGKPNKEKKVWISYFIGGIFTKQHQTYAKVIGKDKDRELIWYDFVVGEIMNNYKITVTHWMDTPDNPILS